MLNAEMDSNQLTELARKFLLDEEIEIKAEESGIEVLQREVSEFTRQK